MSVICYYCTCKIIFVVFVSHLEHFNAIRCQMFLYCYTISGTLEIVFDAGATPESGDAFIIADPVLRN